MQRADAVGITPEAVGSIFLKEFGAVVRQCLVGTCDRDDAEDAVAEGFVRAVASCEEFVDADHCVRWVVVVAKRLLIDGHRSASQRLASAWPIDMQFAVDGLTPAQTLIRSETCNDVARVLGQLSTTDRELLWESDAKGAPVADAAQVVGVTRGSASVLLTRARRRFAESWEAAGLGVPGLAPWLRSLRGDPAFRFGMSLGTVPAWLVAPSIIAAAIMSMVAGSPTPSASATELGADQVSLSSASIALRPAGTRGVAPTSPRQPHAALSESASSTRTGESEAVTQAVTPFGSASATWERGSDRSEDRQFAGLRFEVVPLGSDGQGAVGLYDLPTLGPGIGCHALVVDVDGATLEDC